jgi:hypothetical protein
VVTYGNAMVPTGYAQGLTPSGAPTFYVNWTTWKKGEPLPPGWSIKAFSKADPGTKLLAGLPTGLIRAEVVGDEFLRASGVYTATNRAPRIITRAEVAELERLMGEEKMRRKGLQTPMGFPNQFIDLGPRPDFLSRLGSNLGNAALVAAPVAAAVIAAPLLAGASAAGSSGLAGGAALSGATAAGVTTGAGVAASASGIGASISAAVGTVSGAVSSVGGVVASVSGVAATAAGVLDEGKKLKKLVSGSGEDDDTGGDQAHAVAIQAATGASRVSGALVLGGLALLALVLATRK